MKNTLTNIVEVHSLRVISMQKIEPQQVAVVALLVTSAVALLVTSAVTPVATKQRCNSAQ